MITCSLFAPKVKLLESKCNVSDHKDINLNHIIKYKTW